MKPFTFLIVFFFLGIQGNAQSSLKDTFSFHDADLDVRIESNFIQSKSGQSTMVLAFITDGKDRKATALEKNFDTVMLSGKANVCKIKLSALLNKDSVSDVFYERAASKIISLIVLQCSAQNIKADSKDMIISGANAGAVLAIRIAALVPESFSKTGIFIDSYPAFFQQKDELAVLLPKLKGKFFINTQNEAKNNYAMEFADALALNTGVMIYKVDDAKDNNGKNTFTEFYNWSMADGNNYIISTKQ